MKLSRCTDEIHRCIRLHPEYRYHYFENVGTPENFLIVPVARKSELAALGAGGIPFLGNVWRIGLVPIRRIDRRTEFIRLVMGTIRVSHIASTMASATFGGV